MKIKQQSAINSFLITELGAENGHKVFEKQDMLLRSMINSIQGESRSRFKTLACVIYPRIALYKALAESGEKTAYDTMRKYMIDIVGAEKHRKTAAMEKIPLFFYIYRAAFLMIMKTTDLQKSTQKYGKCYYDITITRCLWHDACVEQGCPELCRLFCDVDDVTYGGLKKLGFTRTQTLGYGGNCCDFHFYRK